MGTASLVGLVLLAFFHSPRSPFGRELRVSGKACKILVKREQNKNFFLKQLYLFNSLLGSDHGSIFSWSLGFS
jgi:hypothetical protein